MPDRIRLLGLLFTLATLLEPGSLQLEDLGVRIAELGLCRGELCISRL